MSFIKYLLATPVVALLLLLAMLVAVVPLIFRRKRTNPPATRFLGTQMDLAILVFGVVLILGIIGSVYKAFFAS